MVKDESPFGKKVLFLHPPGVLSDVASVLSANEFEVYLIHNLTNLTAYLTRHPQNLLFANLDDGMSEQEWEKWIRGLKSNPATASTGIGVMTMLNNPELSRKYLINIGISCGFIVLKIGPAKAADILLKTLEANEARGRRKYIRATCPEGSAEFTAPLEGGVLRGTLQDLSSVGMAAWLNSADGLSVGSRITGIQLSLRGARILLNGVVVGQRAAEGEAPVFVILFEPATVSDEKREKIRTFIRKILQAELNRELGIS